MDARTKTKTVTIKASLAEHLYPAVEAKRDKHAENLLSAHDDETFSAEYDAKRECDDLLDLLYSAINVSVEVAA